MVEKSLQTTVITKNFYTFVLWGELKLNICSLISITLHKKVKQKTISECHPQTTAPLLRHRRFTSDQPAAELKKSQMQH
jgi:hypothetical protein